MSFEAFDDGWFIQDGPYDTHMLDGIRNNFRAVWDECTPAVPAYQGYADTATFSSNPTGIRTQAFYGNVCIWFRPFWLMPGTESLKLHVLGHFGDVTLWFGHSSKALDRNAPQVTAGKDKITTSSDTGLQVYTLERSWGLDVDRPQFTILQLWATCGTSGSETTSSDIDERPDTLYQGTFVEDAGDLEPDIDEIISAYDTDDTLLWRRDIIEIDDGLFSGPHDGLGVYPELEYSPEVHYYGVQDLQNLRLDTMQLEVVRQDSDEIYLPADAEIAGGADNDPTIMDKFDSAASEMALRARPYGFCFPPRQGDTDGMHHPYPVGAGLTSDAYTESIAFAPQYGTHDLVRVAMLCTALGAEEGQEIPATFKLRLFERDNNNSGDPTYLATTTAEDIPIPGQGRKDRGARLVPNWFLPQQSQKVRGVAGEKDFELLQGLWTVVFLELDYGSEDFTTHDTSGDGDVYTDHPTPWSLELTIQTDGDTAGIVALPYIWTEGTDRT